MKGVAFLLALIFTTGMARAQQTFGVYQFSVPAGFNVALDADKTATLTNNAAGQAILLTALNKGDASADVNFTKDWNDYVATQGKLTGKPYKSTLDNGNGWTVVTGKSSIQIEQNQFFIELNTFTRNGQKTSVLFIAMSATQENVLLDFLSGCRLQGKPALPAAAVAAPDITATAKPVATGSYTAYGNMFYQLPAGWKTAADGFNNKLKLMPAKFRESENFFVALLQPVPGATDFNTVAAQTWDMLARETVDRLVDGFSGNADRVLKTLQGFDFVRLQKQTNRQNGLNITIDLILVRTPAGIERIALYDFELRAQGMDYSTVSSQDYYYTTEGLISTIQFKQKPLADVSFGSVKGPEPVGVWCGLSGSYNGVTGNYGQAESFLVFLSNGKVYLHRNMPKGGLANLNTVMHRQKYPDYWADYSYAGGKGSFSNSYYRQISFSIAGGKMKMTKNGLDHHFFKLPSFDGGRINGTYAFKTGESITFTTGGRFTDQGVLHIIAHDLYFEAYQPTTRPGSGTYEIRDYSIIFHYDDGRVFQTAFTDYVYSPVNNSPATLMISENMDQLTKR